MKILEVKVCNGFYY